MRRLLVSTVLLLSAQLSAQVVGYVDSVEVHRTDTIYFEFGSAELDAASLAAVDRLIGDRPAELELYIEGHTDAVGSADANEQLARERSESTLAAAIAHGWPAEFAQLRHFGERQPLVDTRQREWRNRRVLLRSGLPRRYARFRGRIESENGTPLPGGVIAHGRYLRDTVRADDRGYYELYLPLDEPLRVDVYAEGYFFNSRELTLTETAPAEGLITRLPAATPGSRMNVPDLYFVSNSTNLLKESFPVLPRLLHFLRHNPDMVIELAGHVNSPGNRCGPGSWQFTLARDRAGFIRDFLVDFGISAERVRARGYSNFEMVIPRPQNEKERRENRRVEIRVITAGTSQ